MKFDGETGMQLLVTVIVVLVVTAIVWRVRAIRSMVTGVSTAASLG